MVRGVRPLTDIASEFTMMMANRQLDPEIETVFLMADEEFAHVSSSLIKQITPLRRTTSQPVSCLGRLFRLSEPEFRQLILSVRCLVKSGYVRQNVGASVNGRQCAHCGWPVS